MRVLFVTRPHLPRIGGAQITTHAVAAGLAERGHRVTVMSAAVAPLIAGEVLPPLPCPLPYGLRFSPDPLRDMPSALEELDPDVVVVEDRGAMTWVPHAVLRAAAGVPTVMHVQSAGSEEILAQLDGEVDAVVAVSSYLAERVRRLARREAVVVRPAIDPTALAPPSRRRVALLVNAAPQKGLYTVLALARARPDVRFAVARTFHPLEREHVPGLRELVGELPNVELRPATAHAAELYRDARVVLIPSMQPEGFCRVAAEADVCGIPVIAARTGGLAEAAGRHALLLRPGAGVAEWERALASVWDDPVEYARRARRTERAELHPDAAIAAWERELEAVV